MLTCSSGWGRHVGDDDIGLPLIGNGGRRGFVMDDGAWRTRGGLGVSGTKAEGDLEVEEACRGRRCREASCRGMTTSQAAACRARRVAGARRRSRQSVGGGGSGAEEEEEGGIGPPLGVKGKRQGS